MTDVAEAASTSTTRTLRDAGGAIRGTPRGTALIHAGYLNKGITIN